MATTNPWADLEATREAALFLVENYFPVEPHHISEAAAGLIEAFESVGLVTLDLECQGALRFFSGVIAGLIHEWTRTDKGTSDLWGPASPEPASEEVPNE